MTGERVFVFCSRLKRKVSTNLSLPRHRPPAARLQDFFAFAGVTNATAASAVSSKNVNVSCR
jgi:hypothetical protein